MLWKQPVSLLGLYPGPTLFLRQALYPCQCPVHSLQVLWIPVYLQVLPPLQTTNLFWTVSRTRFELRRLPSILRLVGMDTRVLMRILTRYCGMRTSYWLLMNRHLLNLHRLIGLFDVDFLFDDFYLMMERLIVLVKYHL